MHKETRTFLEPKTYYIRRFWHEVVEDGNGHHVCHETLDAFWYLKDAKKIEVVLTDKAVRGSYPVTFELRYESSSIIVSHINHEYVVFAAMQIRLVEAFIAEYGECHVHINLIT